MLKDAVNIDQANSWDGPDGEHWTEREDIYNGAVVRHHRHFMQAAAVQPADRVLDIGCGTGRATLDAARSASAGSALGVDLSSRMLERARQRAAEEGLTNAYFEQADAQVHAFPARAFDAVISRFGCMFFSDPIAALRNFNAALKPGGRLVLMSWLPFNRNYWIKSIRGIFAAGRDLPDEPSGRPGPFGLAEPDHIRSVLAAAGFGGIVLREVREPMWFGFSAEVAYGFWTTAGIMGSLTGVDEDVRRKVLDSLRGFFQAHETPEGVLLDSAAWLTTARKN